MDDRRIGFCRDVARTILKRHRIRRPPINVHEIAVREGFEIEFEDLGSVDGRLRQRSGQWLIEINPACSVEVQRFTIGHELGHAKLGHDGCGENDQIERQANTFAAELLMPLAMLKSELKKEPRLNSLAHRFQVSREAMRIKLEEQNLFMQLERFD